jgi:hypothetical protein
VLFSKHSFHYLSQKYNAGFLRLSIASVSARAPDPKLGLYPLAARRTCLPSNTIAEERFVCQRRAAWETGISVGEVFAVAIGI